MKGLIDAMYRRWQQIFGVNPTSGHVLTGNGAGELPTFQAPAPTYTDEEARDAVGAMLADTATIDLTHNDGANTITADVKNNSIDLTTKVTGDLPFANLAPGAATSVLGVTGLISTDVASIPGTSDQVLRVNTAGDTLGFGTVATGGIANAAVTAAKMVNAGVHTGEVTGTFPACVLDKTAVTNRTAITDQADADVFLLSDASDSDNLKKITRANLLLEPNISVHRNGTDQTAVASSTFTKLRFTTEAVDTHGWFVNDADDSGGATESRFTPLLAGKYLVIVGARIASLNNDKLLLCAIYKNGAAEKYGPTCNSGGTAAGNYYAHAAALVTMNGSTDYIEAFVYHEHGSNRDINGAAENTFMQIVRVSS